MLTSLPLEAARPLLRLMKEIWETKEMMISTVLVIHFGFPQGFHGLWATLATRPQTPMIQLGRRAILALYASNTFHICGAWWMWKRFRRAQENLPAPWKDMDMRDIFDTLSAPSVLRGLHFICVRFGSKGRQIARANPWHFRHSLMTAHYSMTLYGLSNVGGPGGLLLLMHLLIQYETFWVLYRQAQAAFGRRSSNEHFILDYKHKPRFARAALIQLIIFGINIILLSKQYPASDFVLATLPITALATLLLYIARGHIPDYVNPSPTLYGTGSDKLCKICTSAMTAVSDDSRHDRRNHHASKRSLQRSAQQGCRVCAAVWQHASSIAEDFVQSLKFWEPFTYIEGERFRTVVCNGINTDFEYRNDKVADRWDKTSKGIDVRQRIATEDLTQHTGSEESLDIALKWLQNCLVFHGVCNTNHEKSFRPSRLLYLADHSVRIHTTVEMPNKLQYLTLSHCWGKHQLVRLLESNLSSFSEDVPYELLPPTFRDAIRITRRLGFLYLWIDSLCIIQDSPEDWNHEARLMGKIYTNATCNIAASDAPDSSHGCLYPRNPRTIQPEAVTHEGEVEKIMFNKTDIYSSLHTLYTRAWVLQEALLARRTLDCGRAQLFYRCAVLRCSEVFPFGVPTNIYNDNHPASMFKAISADNDQVILNANTITQSLLKSSISAQIPSAPGKGSVERFTDAPFAYWAAIVTWYSGMQLTKDDDRPIAIAGITDVFRPFFGHTAYGMWRIFMPVELLWNVSGKHTHPSTLSRAPSWSWLSVEGNVSYVKCEYRHGRDVLLARFIGMDERKLTLYARVLRATFSRAGEQRARISSIEGETRWMRWGGVPTIPDDFGEVVFDHWDDVPDAGEDMYLMAIQIYKLYGKRVLGLVLREVEDGVFERVGTFEDSNVRTVPFLKRAEKRNIVLI